jgi:hypothetical protein
MAKGHLQNKCRGFKINATKVSCTRKRTTSRDQGTSLWGMCLAHLCGCPGGFLVM